MLPASLLLLVGGISAFAPGHGSTRWARPHAPRLAALHAAASAADRQKILITGNNIEISDSLKERVGNDIGKVISRHAGAVRQVRDSAPWGRAEAETRGARARD